MSSLFHHDFQRTPRDDVAIQASLTIRLFPVCPMTLAPPIILYIVNSTDMRVDTWSAQSAYGSVADVPT